MWLLRIFLLVASPAALASGSQTTTVTCEDLHRWYTDEPNDGALSCCLEDGAQPTDERQLRLPPVEFARLVFEGKARATFPYVTVDERTVHWDATDAHAILTLHDVTKVGAFLSAAAKVLDADGFPYLLIPQTPTIHLFVSPTRTDTAQLVPHGYPYAVFVHAP